MDEKRTSPPKSLREKWEYRHECGLSKKPTNHTCSKCASKATLYIDMQLPAPAQPTKIGGFYTGAHSDYFTNDWAMLCSKCGFETEGRFSFVQRFFLWLILPFVVFMLSFQAFAFLGKFLPIDTWWGWLGMVCFGFYFTFHAFSYIRQKLIEIGVKKS